MGRDWDEFFFTFRSAAIETRMSEPKMDRCNMYIRDCVAAACSPSEKSWKTYFGNHLGVHFWRANCFANYVLRFVHFFGISVSLLWWFFASLLLYCSTLLLLCFFASLLLHFSASLLLCFFVCLLPHSFSAFCFSAFPCFFASWT